MSVLAEVEFFQSRPIAPTRRVALGFRHLPADPAPGPGGVLLGGIVAAHIGSVDDDLRTDILRLTLQVQEGMRIVQPRLRHRFQTDRVGLLPSRHKLVSGSERNLEFVFDAKGSDLAQVLGAIYAAGTLAGATRRPVMDAIRKGLRWQGEIGRGLIAHLSGLDHGKGWSPDAYADPVAWALNVLGIEVQRNGSIHLPDRKLITRRFRELLRDAHPDHGAAEAGAAQRIADLTEARRILSS